MLSFSYDSRGKGATFGMVSSECFVVSQNVGIIFYNPQTANTKWRSAFVLQVLRRRVGANIDYESDCVYSVNITNAICSFSRVGFH